MPVGYCGGIVECGVGILLFGVESRKEIGDGDVHGTPRLAVPAASAGDGLLVFQNSTGPSDRFLFRRSQGLEIGHITQIVLHLFQCAHAAEDHGHTLEGGGEPDGVAGAAAALEPVQNFPGSFGEVRQRAAFTGSMTMTGLPCRRQTS